MPGPTYEHAFHITSDVSKRTRNKTGNNEKKCINYIYNFLAENLITISQSIQLKKISNQKPK